MTTATETFADDAAIVAAEAAHRLPPPAVGDDYPIDAGRRHVLIVEPSGLAYIAPHLPDSDHDPEECLRMPTAAAAFLDTLAATPVAPGRYWASVGIDGNLEIGGRLSA